MMYYSRPPARTSVELSEDSPLDCLYNSLRVPDPRTIDWEDFTAKLKDLGADSIPRGNEISAGIIHQAVSLRPSPSAEAVDALIRFYRRGLFVKRYCRPDDLNPDGHWLTKQTDDFTEYPLSIACFGPDPAERPVRSGCPDVVRVIVRAMASADRKERQEKGDRRRDQWWSLHWKCKEALLGAFINYQTVRPLPLDLMKSIFEEYPDAVFSGLPNQATIAGHVILLMEKESDYWEKIKLVVETAMKGREPLVHSFLRLICGNGVDKLSCIQDAQLPGANPSGVFMSDREPFVDEGQRVARAIDYFKANALDGFSDRDSDGSLPLHYFIGNILVKEREPCKMKAPLTAAQSSIVVEALAKANMKALKARDSRKRLPIHIAIARGLPCVTYLAGAHPEALSMRCGETFLYPFQLPCLYAVWERERARTMQHYYQKGDHEIDLEVVNLAYQLLRTAPTVAQQLASSAKQAPWTETLEFKRIAMNEMKVAVLLHKTARLRAEVETMKAEHRKRKRKDIDSASDEESDSEGDDASADESESDEEQDSDNILSVASNNN